MERDRPKYERLADILGTIVMISGLLVVGPVGGLLLATSAYALYQESAVIATFCGVCLFFPYLVAIPWGILVWREVRMERKQTRTQDRATSVAAEATPITEAPLYSKAASR